MRLFPQLPWVEFLVHQAHARNLQAKSKVPADRTREAAGSNHTPFGALSPGWDGCLLCQLLSLVFQTGAVSPILFIIYVEGSVI